MAFLPKNAELSKRTAAIGQVLQKLNQSQARIITALSGPGIVLRLINLPKMTPRELRNSLEFEAEKYIPFKLKETCLDFSIVGDKPDGRMDLFLVAGRKDLVNAHLDLLASVKVIPAVVDLEALALVNAWEVTHPKPPQEEVVALLHVGARCTILDFIRGAQFQFSREAPIGGDVFTQVLTENLNLDYAQAEALKCDPKERASEVQTVLQPVWEEWLSQCRVSFDFYENQFGYHLNRLAFSGGSTLLAGFKEWVQQATGLPVEHWNPLDGFSVEAEPKLIETYRPSLSVAVGLAVRELA